MRKRNDGFGSARERGTLTTECGSGQRRDMGNPDSLYASSVSLCLCGSKWSTRPANKSPSPNRRRARERRGPSVLFHYRAELANPLLVGGDGGEEMVAA